MEKINLQLLEVRVDALVEMCHQLTKENQQLKIEQTQLLAERDTLLEKNALARSRLEEMIARLKAIEMGTIYE
jgi:cell division protein ZapB